MNETDLAHAIAALSARVSALEGAIHAIARGGTFDQPRVLAIYDAFHTEMIDRYSGLPIDDGVIELVEQSFQDVRELLV